MGTMQVTIIGLGLIGGSIGLALRETKWQGLEIVGYAHRPQTAALALKLGAVNRTELSLKRAAANANLVIISTPVLNIRQILSEMAIYLPPDCIVTDTASTKLQVMKWAEELLPPTVSFIGGHPMAGKETSGIETAEADLFQGCTYCLIPAAKASPKAIKTVVEVVEKVGAAPLFIDAQEHDNLVAAVSHLPALLSAALISATTKSTYWQRMSKLAASGYRDVTRLASGNAKINTHICLTNQEAILHWMDEFIKELERLRQLVADGNEELEEVLAQASEARRKWLEK